MNAFQFDAFQSGAFQEEVNAGSFDTPRITGGISKKKRKYVKPIPEDHPLIKDIIDNKYGNVQTELEVYVEEVVENAIKDTERDLEIAKKEVDSFLKAQEIVSKEEQKKLAIQELERIEMEAEDAQISMLLFDM
jgi:hypothetical protein